MPSTPPFAGLSLHSGLLDNIRTRGYAQPTEIQSLVIPAVVRGENVLALAKTGTGKTAAFMLPVLEQLARHSIKGTAVLVLAPTPELAQQLNTEFKQFSRGLTISSACLLDGTDLYSARFELSRRPAVLFGNPGQVYSAERLGIIDLSDITTLVMDEADSLFSEGLVDMTSSVLKKLPPCHERQTLLLSATLPPEMEGRVAELLPGGKIYNANFETPVESLQHSSYEVAWQQRFPLLLNILRYQSTGAAIIFIEPGESARLVHGIRKNKIECELLSSEMPTAERSLVMTRFRNQEFKFLVTSPELARGLDVAHVSHVIHFTLPSSLEDYRHCSGRAGRAGRTGHSIAFIDPRERWDADVMYTSLNIHAEKLITPARLTPPADSSASSYSSPYTVLDQVQAALGYSFQRPGLLLTTLNRNRFYEDGREKVQMLNFIGRALLPLAITDLVTNVPNPPSLSRIIELGRHFAPMERAENAGRALGMASFVRPDPKGFAGPLRFTNLEQAFFNGLGAIFIDSGRLDAVTAAVLKGVQDQWPTDAQYSLERSEPAPVRIPIGAEVRLKFEESIGHHFTNSHWLDLALTAFSRGEQSFIHRTLLARGHTVTHVIISDLLRRGGFDWHPGELRERRAEMTGMNDVWLSPRGAGISHRLQEHFGWSSETRPELAKSVLTAIVGAIYSDGGYGPAAAFLEPCFPEALEWVEQARTRVRSSADLTYLQELLDAEGQRMEVRLQAHRESVETVRRLAEAERANRQKDTVTIRSAAENHRTALELHVQSEGLGRLQFKVTRAPGATIQVSVRLKKTLLAEAADLDESVAVQEAARLAYEKLTAGTNSDLKPGRGKKHA